MLTASNPIDTKQPAYIPDFCAAGAVFVVVLIAELVAIVLTLANFSTGMAFLISLSKISLFVLWLALLSAALLCRCRRWFANLEQRHGLILSFVLLQILTLLVAETAYRLSSLFPEVAIIGGSHSQFLLRTLAISAIVMALAMRYLYVAGEWRRNVELEAQSRIVALRALIRPHFLFNSMNTIAALTRSDPSQAERAVEDLADLFRATLNKSENRMSIGEELEVARLYERIERLRLGERLQVDWQIDSLPTHALIPSLTLQPLLENAIYHGIEAIPGGGTVTVSGCVRNERIEIVISNPIPELAPTRRAGNRIALANIQQRFELAYGNHGGVSVSNRDGHYQVTLFMPYEVRQQ